MPAVIIRRKHYDKEIVRKIDLDKVHPEYVDGFVKGIRNAFNENEYDIDTSEVEAFQEMVRKQKAAAAPQR